MSRAPQSTRRVARRLRDDERGMTLIELMMGISMGMVVLFAAYLAMDSASKMQTRTQMRVESVTRGRTAMEEMTRAIRAQQCFNGARPMLWASGSAMEFYSSIAPIAKTTFQPTERHRIIWEQTPAQKDLSNGGQPIGNLVEYIWRMDTAGNWPARPTVKMLAQAVEQAPDRRNGGLAPFFRYYRYSAATGSGRVNYNAPVAMTSTQNGVASAAPGDLGAIILIELSFRVTPRATKVARSAAMNFYNTVSVRIADPTNPGGSPQCL